MTYNLTLVLNPDTKDAEKKKIIKSAKDAFPKAKITDKEWGEKKLAYPIEKKSSGIYVNIIAEADEKVASDFEKSLYGNDQILRHLLLRSK